MCVWGESSDNISGSEREEWRACLPGCMSSSGEGVVKGAGPVWELFGLKKKKVGQQV